MTEAPRVGRPPLTDRATLLAAARRHGFAGLTVGAVTAGVGVKYSTFYRHFSSFEALQSVMVHDILSEAEFPPPIGPWRDHLIQTSARMVAVLNAHPGPAAVIMALPQRPGPLVEAFGQTTRVLLEAGFSAVDTVLGAGLAYDLPVTTWADSPNVSSGRASRADQARSSTYSLAEGIREALVDTVDDPPVRWIAARMALLLDGLETRLVPRRDHAGPAARVIVPRHR